MSRLWGAAHLASRRAIAHGALAPLAASLRRDLEPLIAAPPSFPEAKARLSRIGGRCPRDGLLLVFDPYDAQRHLCPRCRSCFTGADHDRWWVMNRQLWLAERAVHAALLARVGADLPARDLAVFLLEEAARRYLSWPNRDNVLGPTRPFFSTYLESIWTLQYAVALDLLDTVAGVPATLAGRVADQLLAPSVELVASYDEHRSNRQVWHNAAMIACARLLGRDDLLRRAVDGPSGLVMHLERCLLADGSWYEGENYHQFAHRGLWYAVTMAEAAGVTLPPPLVQRFEDAFALPFLTALPDETMPARRDSQYATSLRQWRFAESCELGFARTSDRRLLSALGRLYDRRVPRRETGRDRSTAEAERNEPASGLDRASLGWKSLLFACESLPPAPDEPSRSIHLEAQGYAVFRRQGGEVYVALDYGHPGGGHGHPDRLNLWLVRGKDRVLEDVGTGSYTDPSLFWYRSTWAHNAPLAAGASQSVRSGHLRACGERDGVGWIDADVELVTSEAVARRCVVVLDDCLLDVLSWVAKQAVEVTLPWQASLVPSTPALWRPDDRPIADAAAQRVLTRREVAAVDGAIAFHEAGGAIRGWTCADAPFSWGRAVAPGPPGHPPRPITYWSCTGTTGAWRTVLTWGEVREVRWDAQAVTIVRADSETRIALGRSRGEVQRSGAPPVAFERPSPPPRIEISAEDGLSPPATRIPLVPGIPWERELGEAHYRRSEEPWGVAGAPTATLRVTATATDLELRIHVRKEDPVFAPYRAANPMENESPDIHSDGVQLYVDCTPARVRGQWLLVPEVEPEVRVTGRSTPEGTPPLAVDWHRVADGWVLTCRIPRDLGTPRRQSRFGIQVVINDISRDRERRRGQLVATGSHGEWVYLRGDREDPSRLLIFEIPDA